MVTALGAMGVDVPPAAGAKNSRIEEMRGLLERAGLDQVGSVRGFPLLTHLCHSTADIAVN